MMQIVKHCPGCGKRSTIEVSEAAWLAWMQGSLYLVEAMPELTPEQRDQLLTGWHPECLEMLGQGEWEFQQQPGFSLESLIEG